MFQSPGRSIVSHRNNATQVNFDYNYRRYHNKYKKHQLVAVFKTGSSKKYLLKKNSSSMKFKLKFEFCLNLSGIELKFLCEFRKSSRCSMKVQKILGFFKAESFMKNSSSYFG